MSNIDMDAVKRAIHDLLVAIGEDPEREGLKDTPDRVARMYEEIFAGISLTNADIIQKYNKCFMAVETGDLVTVKDIPVFSMCEHHLALMYNMRVSVGYIPKGKVIGLPKIARIADIVAKRLQLQERIGMDIKYILCKILGTNDIIVVVEGEHSCMTARGIKKSGSVTVTSALDGAFKDNPALRQEFYSLIL